MKNLTILLIGFVLLIAPSQQLYAAGNWDTLAPNNLYSTFMESVAKNINSAHHTFTSSLSLFKKLTDEKASYYEAYQLIGDSKKPVSSDLPYTNNSTATFELGNSKSGYQYQLKIINQGEDIFVQFPLTKTKALKNKWIEVPADKYDLFGSETKLPGLFDLALIESGTLEDGVVEKTLALARKHGLFTYLAYVPEDEMEVANANRYDLYYNPKAVAPFYKELSKSLNGEERALTVLGIDGFEKALSNKEFVEYLASYSYVSLWVDKTTNLPVRYFEVVSLPSFGPKKELAISTKDLLWEKINQPVAVSLPKEAMPLTDAAKYFDIDLSIENAEIKDLLKQLSKAKSKQDKAILNYLIAQEYSDLDEDSKAAEYYKKAASNYPKKSVEYYEALAQAEWALKNGAKVIEYYELALKQEPENDLVLNQYGWFLLGLTPLSAKYQNLPKALSLNQTLVSNLVDDSNLQNLYINYLLLGKNSEAKALESKFDNFASGDNYNIIARAYHRLGNKVKSQEFVNKAKQEGYVRTKTDDKFFKLTF
jgi:tetratricopeptide (TPR) repeat protein